eukprot:scaffold3_cov389-Prasinococcus_capsulatus_cf.AAC.1
MPPGLWPAPCGWAGSPSEPTCTRPPSRRPGQCGIPPPPPGGPYAMSYFVDRDAAQGHEDAKADRDNARKVLSAAVLRVLEDQVSLGLACSAQFLGRPGAHTVELRAGQGQADDLRRPRGPGPCQLDVAVLRCVHRGCLLERGRASHVEHN